MYPKQDRELMNRLVRIESKLVRGFEELGVNIDKDSELQPLCTCPRWAGR